MEKLNLAQIAERINPFKLPSLQLEDSKNLPNYPGIYFVSLGSKILYIGESVKVAKRLISHGRKDQFRRSGDVKVSLFTGGSNKTVEQICKDKSSRRQLERILNDKHEPEFYKRPTKYEQPKKSRHISVTEQGWQGIINQAEKFGLSASEFIEQIGRKMVRAESPKAQAERNFKDSSKIASKPRRVEKPILKRH